LSDICHKDKIIPKFISTLRLKPHAIQILRYLPVIWPGFRSNGFLPEYNSRLVIIFRHPDKLKSAIWEKNVMYDMFKQDALDRMPFKMHFGKWIFDLVVNLLRLD